MLRNALGLSHVLSHILIAVAQHGDQEVLLTMQVNVQTSIGIADEELLSQILEAL